VIGKALPLSRPLRALSIGSSNEPQFRLLQTAYQGGLYLLDIDRQALAAVGERVRRQHTGNVVAIQADYPRIFLDAPRTREFVRSRLGGRRIELVTFAHSMYYCPDPDWLPLVSHIYRHVLAPRAALYSVLMAARSDDPETTTWLYNHFAGRFQGHRNDQDLRRLARALREHRSFQGARIALRSTEVRFAVDDFESFMSVIWMILLYPHVHRFSLEQREEITEHVYRKFFEPGRPLRQRQDHLVIYRGIGRGGASARRGRA
jgi:hypothetical protein